MNLTPVQREILLALIDLYHKIGGVTIKGEDIATLVKKNPGTIRNQMQALRSLGLVEGVPGPKGGYAPTTEGYKILNFEKIEREVIIPISIDGRMLEDLIVRDISLIDIADPNKCRATIHLIGSLKSIALGDTLKIGPTPVNKLVITGHVIGRDDIDNVLLIETLGMFSIPKERIVDVGTIKLKTLSPTMTIREGAGIFAREKIRGAPVVENEKPVGMLSTVDVARALAEGKEDLTVREIMTKELYVIEENAFLSKAIEEMEKHNISRLIIVDDEGRAKGIITRTDVLNRIADISKVAVT
ncbi:MAG: CBS domain-containing protein [Candidatus Hydrothermarchaeales archaeon]